MPSGVWMLDDAKCSHNAPLIHPDAPLANPDEQHGVQTHVGCFDLVGQAAASGNEQDVPCLSAGGTDSGRKGMAGRLAAQQMPRCICHAHYGGKVSCSSAGPDQDVSESMRISSIIVLRKGYGICSLVNEDG